MKFKIQLLALAFSSLIFSHVYSEQIIFGDHDLLRLTIETTGPTQADLNETISIALDSCQAREFLKDTRNRLLVSEFQTDQQEDHTKFEEDRYQATIYDYTHGRAIVLNGYAFDSSTISAIETNEQPISNAEELLEASHIAQIKSDEVVHHGMPPFISKDFPDGTSHRLLHLIVTSANSSRELYINMNNRTVESSGPPTKLVCDIPDPAPNASASGKGKPGTAKFVISSGGKTIWTFKAIRPSASSGTRASGIELRDVKYKGKTVLFQAHAPILNVKYDSGCGPTYRDWQWDEWPLHCTGAVITPWLRFCNAPAKTILDPPNADGGDFPGGIAVYFDGQEIVLKTQMFASWYRYVMEWRFHVNGTLKPRFGFGAVNLNNCPCNVHRHHVYWRLDFDIVSAGNNLVREFNGPNTHHDIIYELKRRPKAPHRHWEISNTRTGEKYALIPGPNDGVSDAYGVGDLWVVKYHPGELDDGWAAVSGTDAQTMANIDNFVNGEVVKKKDVVIWYGAHFKHDETQPGGGSHIVGPEIRPVKW